MKIAAQKQDEIGRQMGHEHQHDRKKKYEKQRRVDHVHELGQTKLRTQHEPSFLRIAYIETAQL
jgi:hypothetical protein